MSKLNLLQLGVSLAIGSILSECFIARFDWTNALEHSYYQGIALVAVGVVGFSRRSK